MQSTSRQTATETEAEQVLAMLTSAFPMFEAHVREPLRAEYWLSIIGEHTAQELSGALSWIRDNHKEPNLTEPQFRHAVRRAREDLAAKNSMKRLLAPESADEDRAALVKRWLAIMIGSKVTPSPSVREIELMNQHREHLKSHPAGDGSGFRPPRELEDETRRVLRDAATK